MNKKNIIILAAGLCLAVGTGLYYGYIQKTKEISFTIDGENWSAEGTGSTAVIKLPANPSTGYEWSIESVEGPVSVNLEYEEDEHDAEAVGVGGTELVNVKAEGEGSSELVMKYARNWEGGETDRICRFEITSNKKGNIQSIAQTELNIESETSEGAAAVSIIGGADGPTSIFLAGKLRDGDTANADTIPLVMVDETLYFLIGESDIDGRCGNMDGEITETVDGSEVPTKDNQSNFGAGYGYQYVDENQIDVYMPYGNPDEWRWMRFLKIGAEADLGNSDSGEEGVNHFPGVSMTLTEVNETGAVVSLLNTTDLEVQFGEDYDLQVFENGIWKSLPYLIGDWGFNSIACLLPKGQPVEWKVNWETFHGALQPGHYRLVKSVMDFRGAGDYTNYNLAAEFDIPEDTERGMEGNSENTASMKTPSVVKTYEVTDAELTEEYLENNKLITMVKHYEMSDGTWKTDTHTYQYRLEITGRMGSAVKDSTFVFLSNRKDITFEQAWKAAGFSSNMDDYFDEDIAKFVAMK